MYALGCLDDTVPDEVVKTALIPELPSEQVEEAKDLSFGHVDMDLVLTRRCEHASDCWCRHHPYTIQPDEETNRLINLAA